MTCAFRCEDDDDDRVQSCSCAVKTAENLECCGIRTIIRKLRRLGMFEIDLTYFKS